MDYVEHSQEYQQLVEQGPDKLGLGENEDGHHMHYQAYQAGDHLEISETFNCLQTPYTQQFIWQSPSIYQLT